MFASERRSRRGWHQGAGDSSAISDADSFFSTLLGVVTLVALIIGLAIFAETESDRERSGGRCNTSSEFFEIHLRNDAPTSGAAASYRALGFLVSGDGDGGSCVYEDR